MKTDEEKSEYQRAKNARYYAANKIKRFEAHKKWINEHPGYDAKKKAEQRLANPEMAQKEKDANRGWREKNREKYLLSQSLWREKNREYLRLREAARRANDPELSREKMRIWRIDNPEKSRAHDAKKRASRRKAEGSYTQKEAKRLFALQRGCCAICKKTLTDKYHNDHIVPLARGGSNYIENIQLLCRQCNQHKHAKDPIKHMQDLGFLI